jgi:hypothetical protein
MIVQKNIFTEGFNPSSISQLIVSQRPKRLLLYLKLFTII